MCGGEEKVNGERDVGFDHEHNTNVQPQRTRRGKANVSMASLSYGSMA